MRWLWRLLILVVLVGILRNLMVPQPRAFIVWPERNPSWAEKIQGEMRYLQKFSQDLPMSLQVEVRRLWNGFRPNGEDTEV